MWYIRVMVVKMMSVISMYPSAFWSITSWWNMYISSWLDISVRIQASHTIINIRIIINSIIKIITYYSIHIERTAICYNECIINSISSVHIIISFNRGYDCCGCCAARSECGNCYNCNHKKSVQNISVLNGFLFFMQDCLLRQSFFLQFPF